VQSSQPQVFHCSLSVRECGKRGNRKRLECARMSKRSRSLLGAAKTKPRIADPQSALPRDERFFSTELLWLLAREIQSGRKLMFEEFVIPECTVF
jgi:hypothetical protein